MKKPRLPGRLQLARRLVQIGVLAVIIAVPTVARYHNYLAARELDQHLGAWAETLPGRMLAATDALMRMLPGAERERAGRMQRDRQAVLAHAQALRGGAWSAEIGPVSLTDPLAAAESVAATKHFPRVLLVGLIVPLLATLLLGRVFCSWICPMGLLLEMTDKLRGLLRFLEAPPRNLRFARATKYALLAAGIILAAVVSMPVLGYVYPPALLSRELHDGVFAIFDRAELGQPLRWTAGFSWMVIVLVGIALFEVALSRRWWCRYVCPGGGLYSLIGAARPLRVKLHQSSCTDCALCVAACPMGLNPMQGEMGLECDNCGVCIDACGDDALGYGLALPAATVQRKTPAGARAAAAVLLFALLAWAPPVQAHHILGIPHYAYEEDYPQAPVLTYRVQTGPYEVKMTGYPGTPVPGESSSLHVYIKDAQQGAPFGGGVRLTVIEDRMIGEDPVVYGPVDARLEDRIYKFYPRFESEGNYTARIEFDAAGAPWKIDLPIVVGEPGSPWVVLAAVGAGVLLFLLVVRAARIKIERRRLATAREVLS